MDYAALRQRIPEGATTLGTTEDGLLRDCPRKWAFENLWGHKRPKTDALTIGSILHHLAERYLLCPNGVVPRPEDLPDQPKDERGNYAPGSVLFGQLPGQLVNTTPPGWERFRDRDGELCELTGDRDKAMVQGLIQNAIHEGMLTHLPNGKVEEPIMIPIDPDLFMVSLIDYHSKEVQTVEDHKTTKSLKWAEKPETIAHNRQLAIYAKWLLDCLDYAHAGGETERAEGVWVTHNVFVKSIPKAGGKYTTKKVRGFMDRARIEDLWAEVCDRARLAQRLIRLNPSEQEQDQVPCKTDACGDYGGCPFRSRCTKQNASEISPSPTPTDPMKVPGQPTPFSPPSAPGSAPAGAVPFTMPGMTPPSTASPSMAPPQAKPELQTHYDGAPWANPSCIVCGDTPHNGIQTNGSICPECVKASAPESLPENFNWGFTAEGVWFCTRVLETQGTVVETSTPAPAPTPAPTPTPAQAPTEEEAKPEPKAAGRPKGKSFKLAIDCLPQSGGTRAQTTTLDSIMRVFEEKYAQAAGHDYYTPAEGYPAKRRDFIKSQYEGILEMCKGAGVVFVASSQIEHRELMERLASDASIVWRGIK